MHTKNACFSWADQERSIVFTRAWALTQIYDVFIIIIILTISNHPKYVKCV